MKVQRGNETASKIFRQQFTLSIRYITSCISLHPSRIAFRSCFSRISSKLARGQGSNKQNDAFRPTCRCTLIASLELLVSAGVSWPPARFNVLTSDAVYDDDFTGRFRPFSPSFGRFLRRVRNRHPSLLTIQSHGILPGSPSTIDRAMVVKLFLVRFFENYFNRYLVSLEPSMCNSYFFFLYAARKKNYLWKNVSKERYWDARGGKGYLYSRFDTRGRIAVRTLKIKIFKLVQFRCPESLRSSAICLTGSLCSPSFNFHYHSLFSDLICCPVRSTYVRRFYCLVQNYFPSVEHSMYNRDWNTGPFRKIRIEFQGLFTQYFLRNMKFPILINSEPMWKDCLISIFREFWKWMYIFPPLDISHFLNFIPVQALFSTIF